MNNSTSNDWKIEMPMGGPDGYIGYSEGLNSASFYWEFGGGDVLVIIHIGRPPEWSRLYPWAADRRNEILARVIQDVIRQRAPNCTADTDEESGHIYLSEQKRTARFFPKREDSSLRFNAYRWQEIKMPVNEDEGFDCSR